MSFQLYYLVLSASMDLDCFTWASGILDVPLCYRSSVSLPCITF